MAHLKPDHRLIARHLIGGRVPGDGRLEAAVLQALCAAAAALYARLDESSQSVHAGGSSALENARSAVGTGKPLSEHAQAPMHAARA